MNAVTVARSFPRKNVIYGGGARVQRGRGKRERGRKIGERWRNDEDDRKGYASRPSRNSRREGAETIQKGRNNERDRSSLKGYFSRNPWKGKGGREEEEADPQDSKNPSL